MENRTTHVIRNLNVSIIYQVINIVIKFVLRTIFIKYLGKEYLGINGVFSNVLTVLSLSELGLGTAIIYDMYKPIHNNDKTKITQLFKLYKYIYTIIGMFIFTMGISLIPILQYIITDINEVKNIYFIYILQLISTTLSYFFAQYRTLIDANQLNEVNTKNNIIFNIIRTILQAIVLILFKNYILYLLMEIITQLLSNYFIYLKCKKLFPYIKNKVNKIPIKNIKNIIKNALSMFSIKFGSIVLNATDNIIISSMISTALVGIYSNYTLITSVITSSTMMISSALQASIGNLCISSNYEKKLEVFERVRFLYVTIYGLVFCCFFTLINKFINIWIGENYLLSILTVFFITFNCYLTGVHQPLEIYIYADGLFKYFRIKPWIETLINLVVSIILVKYLGILGVLLGTTISHLITTLWYDSFIVYKYSFNFKVKSYLKKYLKYLFTTFIMTIIVYLILNNIKITNTYIDFIISFSICLIISSLVWFIRYKNADQFLYYKKLILKNRM